MSTKSTIARALETSAVVGVLFMAACVRSRGEDDAPVVSRPPAPGASTERVHVFHGVASAEPAAGAPSAPLPPAGAQDRPGADGARDSGAPADAGADGGKRTKGERRDDSSRERRGVRAGERTRLAGSGEDAG